MSSESQPGPSQPKMAAPGVPSKTDLDAPVTLKINVDGEHRRYKLPLRDMGASSLEPKIREFLNIPEDIDMTIERFSDSAESYILLDRKNVSVYKQLYRAAKAKHKLKLRVTLLPDPCDVPGEELKHVASPDTVSQAPPAMPAVVPVEPAAPRPTLFDLFQKASEHTAHTASTTSTGAPKTQQLPVMDTDNLRSTLFHDMLNLSLDDPFKSSTAKEPSLPTAPAAPAAPAATAAYAKPLEPPSFLGRASRWPSVDEFDAFLASSLARDERPARDSVGFAVCCNSCDETIPDTHYHCSTCDDGDFDLCQNCVDQGITCFGDNHWLIKRSIEKGQIVTSTTETIAPKLKPKNFDEDLSRWLDMRAKKDKETQSPHSRFPPYAPTHPQPPSQPPVTASIRTCNSCVREFPEAHFIHCDDCEDYDLCQVCFSGDGHGHNPKHAFSPAVASASIASNIQVKLGPGRNQAHSAICDGCDKYVTGVRHKCLDCPDWDYCGGCVLNAKIIHHGHRFVPIYEPLPEVRPRGVYRQVHQGICCDGPLCNDSAKRSRPYIYGVRYKCAVCHDTDFCANCEASPANGHNKTHPLIKFTTPVSRVSVCTTGEHGDGRSMPQMGDRAASVRPTDSTSITSIRTMMDVKPTASSAKSQAPAPSTVEAKPKAAAVVAKKPEPEVAAKKALEAPTEKDLVAVFVNDTVADDTDMPPNHVFQQTWTLRNDGDVAWPAGCAVKYVGGDYMGYVDSSQPAGIPELVSASESTICYESLAPGQEFPFTVLLRTPARLGKVISYWRLTSKDGMRFGHRLWCDVNVKENKPVAQKAVPVQVSHEADEEDVGVKEADEEIKVETETKTPSAKDEESESDSDPQSSRMVFPKLEKESPEASVYQEASTQSPPSVSSAADQADEMDDFDDCGDVGEWDVSDADDGFLTDEEYDILDASDEEYLEQQQKRLRK